MLFLCCLYRAYLQVGKQGEENLSHECTRQMREGKNDGPCSTFFLFSFRSRWNNTAWRTERWWWIYPLGKALCTQHSELPLKQAHKPALSCVISSKDCMSNPGQGLGSSSFLFKWPNSASGCFWSNKRRRRPLSEGSTADSVTKEPLK